MAGKGHFELSLLHLVAAWNVEVMSGVPAATLGQEVT